MGVSGPILLCIVGFAVDGWAAERGGEDVGVVMVVK